MGRGELEVPFSHLPGVKRCYFKQGDYLIRMGQRMDYVYYLEKGIVSREMVSEHGARTFLSQKESGNLVQSIVGLLILYDQTDADVADNDFIAMTDCVCYRVPADVCKAYLHSRPDLLEEVIGLAVSVSNTVREAYLMQAEVPAYVQLCQLILANMVEEDGVFFLPKVFTNIEIAKRVASHKVTVSRMLRVLKEEKVIEKGPKGYRILDQEALRVYASGKKPLGYH